MQVEPQVKQYTGYVSAHPPCSLSYRALTVILLYRINIIGFIMLNPNIVVGLTCVSRINLENLVIVFRCSKSRFKINPLN